jgi:7,8-dihydropterin-6-yl-methyl-4-(beta-D-ribofuranosyl)aminobenzene 5'-phosphate synthase
MEGTMRDKLKRRDFLKGCAVVGGAAAAGGFTCVEFARAAPVEVPVVDKLSIRVLIDSSYNLFLRPAEAGGVSVTPVRPARDYRQSLHNQWGLSLFMDSQRRDEARKIMLDFGYTPEALLNNIAYTQVDPARLDAMVVSHGHFDHYGGLQGFLNKYRSSLPPDIKLYAGGEDNFCQRYGGAPGALTEFGAFDRRDLTAHKVSVVLAETPTVVAGHAFTTGKIKRQSIERVLPNTHVEFAMKNGLGCDASHYLPAEMAGKIVPDQHLHEHATCFNIKDRGLVVISSCGHAGIVNSVRQAQEVSGIEKVHVIMGGFHLGPAPPDYVQQVVAEIRKLDPDVLVPMHCSGENFAQEARRQMPGKVLESSTGALITIGA